MSRSDKIRVLVVDDHPVVCRGLTAIIQAEPGMLVVGQASDGLHAVRIFREHKPDITLMDLRMPLMSGVEAIRAIGDEDIHRALKAGAQAYLLKGMSDVELLEAIRNVHSGLRYLPQPVLESLANRPPKSDLSERELQILHLIVKGMSNKRIGENLGSRKRPSNGMSI